MVSVAFYLLRGDWPDLPAVQLPDVHLHPVHPQWLLPLSLSLPLLLSLFVVAHQARLER